MDLSSESARPSCLFSFSPLLVLADRSSTPHSPAPGTDFCSFLDKYFPAEHSSGPSCSVSLKATKALTISEKSFCYCHFPGRSDQHGVC